MTIIRHDGEYAVHAEFRAPGIESRVLSRHGQDGRVYAYHLIKDEFTEHLSPNEPEYARADFQVKPGEVTGEPFMSYASADADAVKHFTAAHRKSIELWIELYKPTDMDIDTAMRHAATNKCRKTIRHYDTEKES